MNRRLIASCAALAAFLLLVSTVAFAGVPNFIPATANAKGILEEEARFHLQAVQNALQQPKYTAFVNNDDLMKELRKNTISSTVVRAEYTYTPATGGMPVTRVYHAKSGKSIEGTVRRIIDGKSGTDSASGSASGSNGSWAMDYEDDVAESRFYPKLGRHEVRALTRLQARNGVRGTDRRARDAELKAMREMEAEFNSGRIPPGGKLTIFVSQPPCSSCIEALTKFSDKYKLNTTQVHHLTNAKKALPYSQLDASQQASRDFFSSRKRYTDSVLVTKNVRPGGFETEHEARRFAGRMEDMEAGRLETGEAACAP